jgi:glutamine synthetase
MPDPASVLRRLADDQITALWVIFHDYNGRPCARLIPPAGFAAALERGVPFAHANLDFNFLDQQATGATFLAHTGDFRAVPAPETYAPVPYQPATGRVHVYLRTDDGAAWDGCPRTRLDQMLAAYAAQGWSLQVGFEPEFTLFTPSGPGEYQPAEHEPMYSLSGLDHHYPLWREIISALQAMDVPVEQFGKEYGPGQYELNIRHAAPVKAVDDYLTLKAVVKAQARSAGWIASFMPKPYAHLAGNGLHVHLSVWDRAGEQELSSGATDDAPLSPLGRHFLGGVLAHAPALVGLGAPIVNSYKRLLPGSWAPAHSCWGIGNRAALIRLPGLGARRHFEVRAGDNACNPFLYLTGLLAAGLDGITRQIEPPAPVADDVGHLSDAEAAARGLTFLPRSLPAALAALEADPVVGAALGPVILPEFLKLKRTELAAYDVQVHPWERTTYLEIL